MLINTILLRSHEQFGSAQASVKQVTWRRCPQVSGALMRDSLPKTWMMTRQLWWLPQCYDASCSAIIQTSHLRKNCVSREWRRGWGEKPYYCIFCREMMRRISVWSGYCHRTSLQKNVKVQSKKVPALLYRRHENIFFQYSKKEKDRCRWTRPKGYGAGGAVLYDSLTCPTI